MDDTYFLKVISGAAGSPLATILRGLLWCATPLYGLVVGVKNSLFDWGLRHPGRVNVPVISIGNITTGGTGKTPTVAWLVQQLQQRGHSPGIVSRGYRSLDGEANDEKRLLDQMLPKVPHHQHHQRLLAARDVAATGCNAIVLDDGFQHRRLHREIDIVLIDALNPFGFGHLLPRGLLRERLKNLHRANAIILTRCDLQTADAIAALMRTIQKYSNAPIFKSQFQPTRLVNSLGETQPLSYAVEHRCSACCAIGNPSAFRRTLAAIGAPVDEKRFHAFRDHHHFTEQELDYVAKQALNQHSEVLLVTRKDLVKIDRARIRELPVWAVDIELILDHPEQLLQIILPSLPSRTTR